MRIKTLEITDDVRDILARCTYTATTVVLPKETLPRPLYAAVNAVLDAAGGKWNRKAGAHLFPAGTDPRTVFEEALTKGEIVNGKKTFQAFYTPPDIAKIVVARAEIRPDSDVLEPSAGDGALVAEILGHMPRNVIAVEISGPACEKMAAWLRETKQSWRVLCADFLKLVPHVGLTKIPENGVVTVDRVVMNPPFTDGQEIEHVQHAFRFLKNGGRLVAVMSNAVQYRESKLYSGFRDWLVENTEDRQIEKLPDNAFRASGTDVSTVLLSCTYRPKLK